MGNENNTALSDRLRPESVMVLILAPTDAAAIDIDDRKSTLRFKISNLNRFCCSFATSLPLTILNILFIDLFNYF